MNCGLCGGERTQRTGGWYCKRCQNERARQRHALRAAGLISRIAPSAEERFWTKVAGGSVVECWIWSGALDHKGYGRYGRGGRGVSPAMAHRWAYEQLVGDIPQGLELDHLCRVKACVNPWHLEPVTGAVNIARQIHARREKVA